MSRSRVRRPFTVEVKSSGRQGHGLTIPSRVPDPPRQADARSVDASSLWLKAERVPEHVAPPPQGEARRVLPSLLVPEPQAPEPELPPAKEPPLPRVRRVKLRPADAVALPEKPDPVPQPIVVAKPAVHSAPGDDPVAAPRRKASPRLLPDLARGERWKRRLPRACW
ncbi:DNA-binding protein [Methylobacterium durans]|uniref:DNA-binding protein n=1 Tax=Methylobacterium durans TaxID=2202825 RepID=A0A2U8WB77_9HYPH|nr:DNA-binding protein [Methylobacterium durans]AWN43387.1 DNA-binding protein [Methylobacterium durans]